MVDVSNPRQTGLAMRVIESLAIDVKVLTNNLNLKQDELIKNSESICFFSEHNVYIDNKFIRDMPSKSTSRLMLSMEDWLKQIFFDQHDEA